MYEQPSLDLSGRTDQPVSPCNAVDPPPQTGAPTFPPSARGPLARASCRELRIPRTDKTSLNGRVPTCRPVATLTRAKILLKFLASHSDRFARRGNSAHRLVDGPDTSKVACHAGNRKARLDEFWEFFVCLSAHNSRRKGIRGLNAADEYQN